jgi:hypothetical protein
MRERSDSKKKKKKKVLKARIEKEVVDPDHFRVYELKPGWEKVMSDVWTAYDIEKFKGRQELFSKIPAEVRDRTKTDESYREGWIDSASWILDNIIRSKDDNYEGKEKVNCL